MDPDPVQDPQEYQRLLLSLLGTRDPAEVQAATVGEWEQLTEAAGPHLRTRPAPSEWSVLLCLAHLVDAEMVNSTRYRWILAHDQPALAGYDQDRWADTLHLEGETVAELLAVFAPLRQANLLLWERTGPAERQRFGLHAERGPESYELLFRMTAGHDLFHLAQARRALSTVGGA
ncbi:MAG TPA: DinB family protein [Acidimicrobiia bacterium]|nr:DinB family protein [Acidimicrobiia bacterium]